MNLEIYEKVRVVPENAKKEIKGGRLKGKTDINPMWRIKTLTEMFGVCGSGWKYEVLRKELHPGANGEMAAFVDINLYVKIDGQWSEPIPGTGGSMFVAKEKDGPYVNDECFKMALTDAISVACKALGVGADVYWQEDRTKYDGREEGKKGETKPAKSGDKISEAQIKRMFAIAKGDKDIIQRVLDKCGYEKEADVYKSDYNDVCALIEAELQGETKVEMATWEQIDEISKLAKGKYGDNKEEYKAALKTLHEMGKISTPFPIDRNKNIKWTVEDYKAVKEDLETPF